MRIVKTPFWAKWLYPSLVWNIPNEDNAIFLTFDDGPIDLTEDILDILDQYNVKATFFCVGENILKNPVIYQRIIAEGHDIGNHTYNHLNNFKTTNENYLNNVALGQAQTNTELFRPPYGKITRNSIKALKQDYKIIMWDILSYDFDQSVSPDECLNNVTNNIRSGSIIVFHDNIKAKKSVLYALPKLLEWLQHQSYLPKKISDYLAISVA